MSFPRYPEYKDSGVEWLGEVPWHWAVVKLKTICHMQSGEFISSPDIHEEGPYPVYGGNGQRGFTSTYTHSGLYPIIGRQGALCGNVNYASGDFWASEHAVVVTPEPVISPVWLGELLRSMDLNQYSITAAQPGLAVEKVKNLHVPYPSPAEQKSIAAFLYHETARIDALVAQQQRLIELLKEKRQAVISHAVTKGLNPDVAMKDSGVEWLGDVPAHWALLPLKRSIALVESGTSVNAIDTPATEGEIGVLKTSCVYKGWFDWRENKTVNPEEVERVSCQLRESTLIVSRMNTPELIGALGVVTEAPMGIFLPDRLWQVSLQDDCSPHFFYYFAQSAAYRAQVKIACAGTSSSMQNLGQDEFGAIWYAAPPRQEQQDIATFLNAETTRIDNLIDEGTTVIALLQERRSALISAAVTGKIDVRGWQPPPGSSAPTEATATESA